MTMRRILLISFLLLVVCKNSFAQRNLIATNLRCEYLKNPLALDTKMPRLSWELQSAKRNAAQSAYEIVVRRNEGGVVWNSGKVASNDVINITCKGQPLQSFQRYAWRVKVYDENGKASPWSEAASFETGAFSTSDWKAKWISDGSKNPARDEDYYKPDRMPLLRKEFSPLRKIAAARLYISGVGYGEAYLNGKKISDQVLSPGFTTYRKQVQYVVHDITSVLAKGKNVLGVMLGSGWWNPLPIKLFGRWDLREVQQTGRPCVKAELHLAYTDGTKEIIATDESWKAALGPVVQNNVYLGEKYDARLEQKNWNNVNADASVWKPAVVVDGPAGELVPQMQPPIRVTKVFKPVRILEAGKDTFIVDMGQNFAGVARIRLRAPAGTKVGLRYGEDLLQGGSLNYYTTAMTQIKKDVIKGGPGAPETAWQRDEYTANGKGEEQWSPRFTFHGFRYLEITGWPGKPTLNDVDGLRMNSDVEPIGQFACSNEAFNKLHEGGGQYEFSIAKK